MGVSRPPLSANWLLGKRTGARQNNPYFGELTRLGLDLN